MIPRLHLVTDDRVLADGGWIRGATEVLEALGPSLALHVRGPGTDGRRIWEVTGTLREPSRVAGAWLLVNDRVDVARSCAADGVQLGARSLPAEVARSLLGPRARIGVSVHDPGEAAERAAGADFQVVGTIFRSPSHPERPAAGVERIARTSSASRLPVIAIGGVTPEGVGLALAAGAHGVAVLSGVWDAPDPVEAALGYRAALEAATRGDGEAATPAPAAEAPGPDTAPERERP